MDIGSAITRLRKLDELYISKGYKPLVLFSGGKDSLVVLDLCYRYFGSDMYVAYIHVPGNTHEECDYYVLCTVERYLGSLRRFYYMHYDKFLRVRGREVEPNFFIYALEYGIPMYIRMRWCMRIFKIEPLTTLPADYILLSGEKQSDNWWRFKYLTEQACKSEIPGLYYRPDQYHKHYNLKLIYDWSSEHVKKYIRERELKLNPLYSKVGHSGNCMICPAYISSVDRLLRYLNLLERNDARWYNVIMSFFREYMKKHRQLVKCDRPCSRCPYMNNRKKYIFAKRIGIVLELLENSIFRYL